MILNYIVIIFITIFFCDESYGKKRINIDEAKDLIKFRTHQYAKRQITWLKHQMISWKSFSTQESDKIIDYFIKKL